MRSVIRDVNNAVMGSKALSGPMKLDIYKSKKEQDLAQDMLPERVSCQHWGFQCHDLFAGNTQTMLSACVCTGCGLLFWSWPTHIFCQKPQSAFSLPWANRHRCGNILLYMGILFCCLWQDNNTTMLNIPSKFSTRTWSTSALQVFELRQVM